MKSLLYLMKEELPMAGIAAFAGILILSMTGWMAVQTTAFQYPVEIWIRGCNCLDFFFPLLVTLPFTWRLYFEKKDSYLGYVSIRTDLKQYLMRRISSGVIVVFCMTFVIYYVGLLIVLLFIKIDIVVRDDILYRYLWGNFQAEHPCCFALFWCLWKSLVGSVIAVFGYIVSLLAENLFAAVFLPFLYCMIENFITGSLGLEAYSLCTTYILNRLSPQVMTPFSYCAGLLSFLLTGSLFFICWIHKKKKGEVSETYYCR